MKRNMKNMKNMKKMREQANQLSEYVIPANYSDPKMDDGPK